MKTIGLAMLALLAIAAAGDAGELLTTLKDGSWVCETPEAYDLALAEQRRNDGDLEDLKKRLLDQKLCIYMDSAFVARMMAPFARVLERQDDKVKVEFTVQYRKRLETFRRQLSRVTFVGWTGAVNLLDKEIL